MKNRTLKLKTWLAVSAAAACAHYSALAQTNLFSDNFDTDTSASWTIRNSTPADYTAQFAFDYSTQAYNRYGTNAFVPPAPNGGGKGLKLTVNKNDATAAAAAVNVYPNTQNFTNDFALRVDMWINYAGGSYGDGGSGTTEYGLVGINHIGDKVNWETANPADGLFFAVTGEGGSGGASNPEDYPTYLGDNVGLATRLGPSSGYLDRDGDGQLESEVSGQPFSYPLKLMFPPQRFESPGSPGKQWVQVEVRQRTNDVGEWVVTWLMDGYVISEHKLGTFQTPPLSGGNIMLGTMDLFSSISSPLTNNWVIYDNVRVVDLTGVAPLPVIAASTGDGNATEGTPSDIGLITLTRTGPTDNPLTVRFRAAGTATRGSDYTLRTNSVTFTTDAVTIPAGAQSIDIELVTLNDTIAELEETAYIVVAGNPGVYDVREGLFGRVAIADDGLDTPVANLSMTRSNAYERISSEDLRFSISLTSPGLSDITVNYTLGGTAVNGTHYDLLPTSVVIPAGQSSALISATNLVNDSAINADRTVILTLTAGTGYLLGTNTSATGRIINDDLPVYPVAYLEDFETGSGATNWGIKFSAASGGLDYRADYGFDYGLLGIPPAPNSAGATTKGLLATVNKDATAAAASVNIYNTNRNFTGYYALRFDMFMSVGSDVGGTTEHAIFGINHTGNFTNRHAISGSDGLWFAVETDGSANNLYASYVGSPTAAPTATTIQTLPGYFLNPPWGFAGIPGSPSVVTNAATLTGGEYQWADVQVNLEGARYTMLVNGVQIFQRTNTSQWNSGKIMLGHMDRFNSIGSTNTFTIFDNVRVVTLPTPAINITKISVVAGNVEVEFDAGPLDGASLFGLQTSAAVDSGYADVTSTVTAVGPGKFKAVRAVGGPAQFYRIRRL